jgi:hypothetical protein
MLATWQVEIRMIMVQDHLGKKTVHETPSQLQQPCFWLGMFVHTCHLSYTRKQKQEDLELYVFKSLHTLKKSMQEPNAQTRFTRISSKKIVGNHFILNPTMNERCQFNMEVLM